MNLNSNVHESELAALLTKANDDGDHIIWADANGDVFISTLAEDQDAAGFQESHPDMRLRTELIMVGSGHVGPEAANDPRWLAGLLESLRVGWEALPSEGVHAVA